jgi:hypothetical protein
MACLSDQQLAQLALGLTEDSALTAHLKECASCRASGEKMQLLVHQLTAAHAKFDNGHEEARERLLTLLPAATRPSEPTRSRNRITYLIGELSMRQRIAALGGVGVSAVLMILLFWIGSIATPVSAMEKMAENIRKAKSCKYMHINRVEKHVPIPGKPPYREYSHVIYWLAPDSDRCDSIITYPRTWKGPGPEDTDISPVGKPGIFINHQDKTFYRYPCKQPMISSKLQDLGNLSGEAEQELGFKEIGGQKARGFLVNVNKIYSDYSHSEPAEIWVDVGTNLPLLVRYKTKFQFSTLTTLLTDIQWNIDLDPKLFDTTPPAGYTDATPKTPTLEEQGPGIVEALKIYAEASGGRYPRNISELIDDLCKMYGIDKYPAGETEGNAGKAAKAIKGSDYLNKIKAYNADAAYNGETVKSSDKDKVLFRWKLDDGKYAIIYGDLHYETVSAERLRELEGK